MKKTLTIVICLLIAASLAGCGNAVMRSPSDYKTPEGYALITLDRRATWVVPKIETAKAVNDWIGTDKGQVYLRKTKDTYTLLHKGNSLVLTSCVEAETLDDAIKEIEKKTQIRLNGLQESATEDKKTGIYSWSGQSYAEGLYTIDDYEIFTGLAAYQYVDGYFAVTFAGITGSANEETDWEAMEKLVCVSTCLRPYELPEYDFIE